MRQNGTSIIFLQYCQSPDRKTLLNTEIAIPPKFWNKKLNRVTDDLPIEYGTAKSANLEIHRLFRMAEDIITFAIRLGTLDPVNFVRQTFSPDFDISLLGIEKHKVDVKIESEKAEKLNLDFFFQFDQYLKSKESTVSRGTMDVLRNLKVILEKFQNHRNRKIRFDQIDLSFYEEYVHYLTYDHVQFRKIEPIKGLKLIRLGKTSNSLLFSLRIGKLRN